MSKASSHPVHGEDPTPEAAHGKPGSTTPTSSVHSVTPGDLPPLQDPAGHESPTLPTKSGPTVGPSIRPPNEGPTEPTTGAPPTLEATAEDLAPLMHATREKDTVNESVVAWLTGLLARLEAALAAALAGGAKASQLKGMTDEVALQKGKIQEVADAVCRNTGPANRKAQL